MSDQKQQHQKRGAFIVFEGIDRSGKTTQCQLLTKALNKVKAESAIHLHFPNRDTPIGRVIDLYLNKKIHLTPEAVQLLFAADRREANTLIRGLLQAGATVVSDRYSFSAVAYGATTGLPMEWCAELEMGLVAPDVVIFLDISTESAQKRGGYGASSMKRNCFNSKSQRTIQRCANGNC